MLPSSKKPDGLLRFLLKKGFGSFFLSIKKHGIVLPLVVKSLPDIAEIPRML
jgi:hypothetical protein